MSRKRGKGREPRYGEGDFSGDSSPEHMREATYFGIVGILVYAFVTVLGIAAFVVTVYWFFMQKDPVSGATEISWSGFYYKGPLSGAIVFLTGLWIWKGKDITNVRLH